MVGMFIRTDSFEVRSITQADIDAVLNVYRQCEDFLSLGPKPTASLAMVLEDVEISQRAEGVFCGVFAGDKGMIGVVDFVPNNFEGNPRMAFFSLLMIALSFRNRGMGSKIVELIENEIRKDAQVMAILSAVQTNNPKGLRFWQKNGYRIVGEPQLQPDHTTTFRLQKDLTVGCRAV
jgi:ribosomal protein S18 acetylase RimI-like enzyme